MQLLGAGLNWVHSLWDKFGDEGLYRLFDLLVFAALIVFGWILTKKNFSPLTKASQLCATINTVNAFVLCWLSEHSAVKGIVDSLFNLLVLSTCKNRAVKSIGFPGGNILLRQSCCSLHSLSFLRILVAKNIRVLI